MVRYLYFKETKNNFMKFVHFKFMVSFKNKRIRNLNINLFLMKNNNFSSSKQILKIRFLNTCVISSCKILVYFLTAV